MRVKKAIKRAANGAQTPPKKTPDSTGYYSRKLIEAYGNKDFAGAKKASADVARQSKKGQPGYDASGYPVKKKMKGGGSLKPVDSSKNPGLAKLPTAVRNKMGYQKNGGKAQVGVSLRSGQLKRLGRLTAKDADKAKEVGSRMVERATRKQRGREFIKKNISTLMPQSRKGSKVTKKCRYGCK